MKKVTIRTIAATLGLAPSTVWKALANRGSVDAETRKRILTKARQMGYRFCHDKYTVGILVARSFMVGVYDGWLLYKLSQELSRRNFMPVLIFYDDVENIDSMRLDGLIVTSYSKQKEETIISQYDLPVVRINEPGKHIEGIFSVVSDDGLAISQAIEHFFTLGHRRIALFSHYTENYSNTCRSKKFFSIIKKNPGVIGFEYDCETSFEFCLDKVQRDGITAILFPSEETMLKHLKVFRKRGIRIPEDISIITWESPWESCDLEPPMTTFKQDYDLLAKSAVDMLEMLLEGRSYNITNKLIPYKFILRSSTSAPPPAR